MNWEHQSRLNRDTHESKAGELATDPAMDVPMRGPECGCPGSRSGENMGVPDPG